MKVREYSIKKSVNVDEVIESLKTSFEGINWLKTSPLQTNHLEYLDTTFAQSDEDLEQKQISGSQPLKQLASSKTEEIQQPESISQLATTKESSLTDAPAPKNSQSHLTTIEQIEQITSELQITRINQRLDDDYTRLVNTFNAHDKRKEDFLLSRLENTYQSVKQHKPLAEETHSTSRFDDLMSKIDALGLDTKSR